MKLKTCEVGMFRLPGILIEDDDGDDVTSVSEEELKDTGFKIGVDFDFAYSPGRWDEMIGEIPKQTEFTFYNEKLATWSILKWSE